MNITNRSYGYDFFYPPRAPGGHWFGHCLRQRGHIITNYHVIEDADELFVTLPDETTVAATVVGADPSNDLAVLKVDVAPRSPPSHPAGRVGEPAGGPVCRRHRQSLWL